jgi:hypothetical protein
MLSHTCWIRTSNKERGNNMDLLIHQGDSGVDVGEGGEASEGDSGSISPSNLRWNSPCFCVSCFSTTSDRDRPGEGVIYRRF